MNAPQPCQGNGRVVRFVASFDMPRKESKECPLCGENMRLVEQETVERLPGTSEVKRHKSSEWVCPECDYFEEAESEEVTGR